VPFLHEIWRYAKGLGYQNKAMSLLAQPLLNLLLMIRRTIRRTMSKRMTMIGRVVELALLYGLLSGSQGDKLLGYVVATPVRAAEAVWHSHCQSLWHCTPARYAEMNMMPQEPVSAAG